MKSEKPKFVILKTKETLLQSLIKDTYTFAFLLLCIYVSQGSAWWTFFTGVMALIFIIGLIGGSGERTMLYSKKEAVDWASKLEDDNG